MDVCVRVQEGKFEVLLTGHGECGLSFLGCCCGLLGMMDKDRWVVVNRFWVLIGQLNMELSAYVISRGIYNMFEML